MERVIFYTTFIPIGAIYLHARTFFTLADTTSIPVGAMYLHARMLMYTRSYVFYTHGCNVFIQVRMFCTLTHTTSIPVGVMNLNARTF